MLGIVFSFQRIADWLATSHSNLAMGKHLMFRCSESWNKQYKFIEKSAGADVEIHHRGTTDKLKIGAVSVRLKVRYLALFRANLLLIAVMALVTSTAAALSKPFSFRDDENYHFDYDDELDYIRTSIIQGLGLDRIPDPAKVNPNKVFFLHFPFFLISSNFKLQIFFWIWSTFFLTISRLNQYFRND